MIFFSRSAERERENKKKKRGRDSEATAPCSLHAVVISLCGGEFNCFPLVLTQSNILLRGPRSFSSDSFVYDCYVCGRFWLISAMFWMGEPAVYQPFGLSCSVPRGSVMMGGVLYIGAPNSMAAGQRPGQPPAADVISAFFGYTLRMCH